MRKITIMEFPSRGTLLEIEEGKHFMPRFDDGGLIPCVTQDWQTHEVLMLGWMNREALARTLETGLAHYYSRARQMLWKKGEQSGQAQVVKRILIDDDQDCLWRQPLGAPRLQTRQTQPDGGLLAQRVLPLPPATGAGQIHAGRHWWRAGGFGSGMRSAQPATHWVCWPRRCSTCPRGRPSCSR